MAQKLFVNMTAYTISGELTVRKGDTPGDELGVVNITLTPGPGTQQMVEYGDANDPYMDQLELSAAENGAIIISDQIVIARSSSLDNEFNMNDTIYVNIDNNQFVITTANTWTV